MAAAAITKCTAAVSMKKDFQRRTVAYMIVPSEKHTAIKGHDADILAGNLRHDMADAENILSDSFIL